MARRRRADPGAPISQGDDLVPVDLTQEERYMLTYGLFDWDGPVECTDALARAMGFAGVDDLHSEGQRIGHAIYDGDALTVRDWTRAVRSTQILFSIHHAWGTIHGGVEADWLAVLRGLQRKVPQDRRYLPS